MVLKRQQTPAGYQGNLKGSQQQLTAANVTRRHLLARPTGSRETAAQTGGSQSFKTRLNNTQHIDQLIEARLLLLGNRPSLQTAASLKVAVRSLTWERR